MKHIIINDRRTLEVLKGKKYVAEINAGIFEGYVTVANGEEFTAVVLELNEINGVPTVIAEAYPEDSPEGTLPEIKHFPFTETTTIKELFIKVAEWVQDPPVAA